MTGTPPPRFRTVRRIVAGAPSLFGSARRPLTLALAAIGLALVAAGLHRPQAQKLSVPPPGVVALVNQQPVLTADFVAAVEEKTGSPFAESSPGQRAQVLRSMIDQELLVQRALALDLPEQDTETRATLQESVTGLITAPVASTRPGDAELRAYYAAHRANYANHGSMAVTDLVLHIGGFENADQTVEQGMADAAEAAFQLRSGANVDTVREHFGFVDTGRVVGLEEDFAAKIHLGAKLYAIADKMSDGEISPAIDADDGVHLLLMNRRIAPIYNDYGSVQNNVYADYLNQRKINAANDNLKSLRSAAEIALAPGQRE